MPPPPWPTDRILEIPEIHHVILSVLKKTAASPERTIQAEGLVNPDGIANLLGMAGQYRAQFAQVNRGVSFIEVANRFVIDLFRAGVIEPDFRHHNPMAVLRIAPGAEKFLDDVKLVPIFNLIQATRTLVNQGLRERVGVMLAAGCAPDSAVREAVTYVESELRRIAGLDKTTAPRRADLAGKAFAGNTGRLICSDDPAVQDGIASLFRGYFETIANDQHHSIVDISATVAAQILVFSDYLLGILLSARPRESTPTLV